MLVTLSTAVTPGTVADWLVIASTSSTTSAVSASVSMIARACGPGCGITPAPDSSTGTGTVTVSTRRPAASHHAVPAMIATERIRPTGATKRRPRTSCDAARMLTPRLAGDSRSLRSRHGSGRDPLPRTAAC